MNENKALITEYLNAISGQPKTPDLLDRYVADKGLADHVAEVEAAFPSYELLAGEMLADGDKVVVRGTFRGTHRGPFAGIEPTGRQVTASLIIIYRVENRRIAEYWLQFDLLSLLQQLQDTSAATSA